MLGKKGGEGQGEEDGTDPFGHVTSAVILNSLPFLLRQQFLK